VKFGKSPSVQEEPESQTVLVVTAETLYSAAASENSEVTVVEVVQRALVEPAAETVAPHPKVLQE
jgi:hypothetical protein